MEAFSDFLWDSSGGGYFFRGYFLLVVGGGGGFLGTKKRGFFGPALFCKFFLVVVFFC